MTHLSSRLTHLSSRFTHLSVSIQNGGSANTNNTLSNNPVYDADMEDTSSPPLASGNNPLYAEKSSEDFDYTATRSLAYESSQRPTTGRVSLGRAMGIEPTSSQWQPATPV